VIDFYGNSENIVVSNNRSTNTMGEFLRLHASWPARVYSNIVERNVNAEPGLTVVVGSAADYTGVGRVGAEEVEIFDNQFVADADNNHGVAVVSYDYSVPSKRIRIHHNSFVDFKFAVGVGGPFQGVSVEHNSIRGPRYGNLIQVLNTGGNVIISSRHGVPESEGLYEDLAIVGNTIVTSKVDSTPIHLNFAAAAPFPQKIGDVIIRHNVISALKSSSAAAIAAVTAANPYAGRLFIDGNSVSKFETAFYVRRFTKLTLVNNETREIKGAWLTQAENGTVEK
jgi:hypothetical protein